MMKSQSNEGLRLARLLMVLSGLSPLFVLWAVRGIDKIPDVLLWSVCGVLIVLPNVALYFRMRIVRVRKDTKTITVGKATDNREHLLVYLFAMLIPLYDVNLSSEREAAAAIIAFVFVVFLFWHLNLHYMNLVFALAGYRVFTIEPPPAKDNIGSKQPFVLLTKRSFLAADTAINAYRISNTVLVELE